MTGVQTCALPIFFALLLFLFGRFSVTMARLENHRLLRPSASFLLLGAYICFLTALGIAGVKADFPKADVYIAKGLYVLLGLMAAAYYWTKISHTVLFWAAFILTRPLGAVVGDFLDKPLDKGGLALSRYSATAALLVAIGFFIFAFPHKPAKRIH